MKIKIILIVLFIILVALIVLNRKKPINLNFSQNSNSNKNQSSLNNYQSLTAVESKSPTHSNYTNTGNQIDEPLIKDAIQKRFGEAAYKANETMEAHLKSWNPVGRTAQEIKNTFGQPDREKPEAITYLFDNGETANIFVFELREGVVTDLKRPPSE